MFQQKDNVSDNSICNAKAINHVCLAVKNIEASIALYSKMFGVATPKIQIMLDQKVKAAMVNVGNTNLEFIEPIDGEGGVAKFINNKGEGIHHICFEVENIGELEAFLTDGLRTLLNSDQKISNIPNLSELHKENINYFFHTRISSRK